MRLKLRAAAAATLLAFGCGATAGAGTPAQVERGRYLATELSGCAHCHTGPDGRLSGRDMDLSPKELAMNLAPRSKPIAGLPAGRSEAEVSYFLQHAEWPGGARARPPMPPYKIHKEDADAIAAYLASQKR